MFAFLLLIFKICIKMVNFRLQKKKKNEVLIHNMLLLLSHFSRVRLCGTL